MGGGRDLHAFVDLPDRHIEIDARALLHLQLDAGLCDTFKTGLFDFDVIDPRLHRRKAVEADIVCCGASADIGGDIRCRHQGARNCGATGIVDLSADVAESLGIQCQTAEQY